MTRQDEPKRAIIENVGRYERYLTMRKRALRMELSEIDRQLKEIKRKPLND